MSEKLGIKIYGITKVGPKGQIIIPKECRGDIGAEAGSEFDVVMIERKTFGIGLCSSKAPDEFLKNFEQFEIVGQLCLGSKFQFVIPSQVRKILDIQVGDNLLVLGKMGGLGFIKNDKIDFFFDFLKRFLTDNEKQVNEK